MKNKIITELKRIANQLNQNTVLRDEFIRLSSINSHHIYKYFKTWNDALLAAGLSPNLSHKPKTDNELLENLYDICCKIGRIPTTTDLNRNSKTCIKTYRKKFGSWEETLMVFKEWLLREHGDSNFINLIPYKQENVKVITECINNDNSENNSKVWKSNGNVIYGAPIDFKGLRHAPVNEQGVVFLFGKMNEDLGIIVEVIRTQFPDCEGKRLIDKNKKLYEPVLIEFEYQSRNYKEHGHPINGCDLIVCWEHNWKECPIEVIELKQFIKKAD